MADFFTRLTERTLGIVPVAQPVIASMFAPRADWNSSADASVGGVAVEIEQAISPPPRATRAASRPPTLTEEPSVQLPPDVRHPRSAQQHTRNGMVAPVSPVQEAASNRLQVEHLEPQVQAFSEARRDIHVRMPALEEPPALAASSPGDPPAHEDVQVITHHQDHASYQAASAPWMYEEEGTTEHVHRREAMSPQEDAPLKQTEQIITQEAEQGTRNVHLRASTASPHAATPIPTIPTRRLSSRGGRPTQDGESISITASPLPGRDHASSNLFEVPQPSQQTGTETGGLEQLPGKVHITTDDEKKASAAIFQSNQSTQRNQGNGLEHPGTHPDDETQTREYSLQEIMPGGSRKVEEQGTRSQQPEEAVWTHAEMQSAQIVTHTESSRVTGSDSVQYKAEYASPIQAPTIHVTIGRIDVRAVATPPPAPGPRTGRQEPKVSLKQYLGRQQ